MNTIEDLRAALDYAAAPARPDTAAIIARGRRRRFRRRAAVGGGIVAVVTAVVAVNPWTVDTADVPPLHGSAPTGVLVAALTAQPYEAPERFDPLTRTLHIGWVPDGLTDEQAVIEPTAQTFGGFDEEWEDGGKDFGLVVKVLAKGQPVSALAGGALGMPTDPVERPTDAVNGRPAVCLSDPAVSGSCGALRWEYAPEAWARVSYAGSRGHTPAAAAAVVRRVAESVRLTAAEPVRLPFTLTGPTADLHAASTLVRITKPGRPGRDGERWSAQIILVDDPAEADGSYGEARQLVIGVRRTTDPSGRTSRDAAPNTMVDDHEARHSGAALVVWNVSGTRVFTEYQNWNADPTSAYADLRVLADPADPAGWRTVR
ncbi:hypothetical protein [Asanoa siamensis]|uniref:LigA protein n=1 Tax=Asanoa siamensis TaxID=926357 RepID=A0ABQ4CLN0_9ACTN|nr:hypothetical protein [Asanoa siamensis]GIF72189.1 hypothetical protein Asi02nite_17070 [Asanoa siamensis]